MLTSEGLSASTVQNTLDPLRVICRRAVRRDVLMLDPTEGLELRRPTGRRERIASPDEATALLAALPDEDRALWATALYAGLRRGELRALRWADVDLRGRRDPRRARVGCRRGRAGRVKSVAARPSAGADPRPAGEGAGRTQARGGRRDGDALASGRTATEPFIPSTVRTHAIKAWERENSRRTKRRLNQRVRAYVRAAEMNRSSFTRRGTRARR